MEFEIRTKKRVNLHKYTQTDVDIAYTFAKEIYKEFGRFLKAIVLFGSAARGKNNAGDIDILLVVDDVSVQMTQELVQTYRIITEKTIARVSVKLHVITMRFTSFWEYVRAGDPVAINMLRDGVPIIDTGFFSPLQHLLAQGRIRPSPEAIWSYFSRAPITLHNSQWHIQQAIIDLYWSVIDASHAALMKMGESPPSPSHIAQLLEEKLVKRKLLHARYPKIMEKFYHLQKDLSHGRIHTLKGKAYDDLYKEAADFVDVMQEFIRKKHAF